MKFKYVGQDDCFCLELVAYDIFPKDKFLKNGDIIEVPDNLERIIASLEVDGNYQRVQDNTKKNNKEKK